MDDSSLIAVPSSETASTAPAAPQSSQTNSTNVDQHSESAAAAADSATETTSAAAAATGTNQDAVQGNGSGAGSASYLTILPVNCIMNVVRSEVNTVVQSSMQSNGKEKRKSSGESTAPKIKISNEARQCFVDSATEFVMFITQEASDRCVSENRRTLTGSDIVAAIENLGFGSQYAMIARMALSRSSSGSYRQGSNAAPLVDMQQSQQQEQQTPQEQYEMTG